VIRYYLLFALFLNLLFSFFAFNLSAQNVGIHAESVGEWQSNRTFFPDYHYNSVAVFLLNEGQLFELFDANNLTREERKKVGVRYFDKIESLHLYLEMPNPKQVQDSIIFPMYAFDVKQAKSFKILEKEGKIIDRITDEELNGRALNATAKIEAVQKNQLLEVAYRISSSINKIVTNSLFAEPSVWGMMGKAQQFFEDKYKGKIVSEFSIPILPKNEDYEYILQSASLYQIKWNFQELVKPYKDNVWSDILDKESVSEEELKDKPTRLSKLKGNPYLLVARYKSAYSLPETHKLNVEISQEYLQKRLFNLQEFRKGSIAYQTEESFLTLLRDALDLKRNCEEYQRAKEKGEPNSELLLEITQQQFGLLMAHKTAFGKGENNPELKAYLEDNYRITYYKLFKQIDELLFFDQQLKELSQIPALCLELKEKDLSTLAITDLYQHLNQLKPYRELTQKTESSGDLFFMSNREIIRLEKALYARILEDLPNGRNERVQHLNMVKTRYVNCIFCQEKAEEKAHLVQKEIEDGLRNQLAYLQEQHLRHSKCFYDIQESVEQYLATNYPNSDSLSGLELSLFKTYREKQNILERIALDFNKIGDLNIAIVAADALEKTLDTYHNYLSDFQSQACQLHYGGVLGKEVLDCLEGGCRIVVP
jgi:hypothetical protein